MERYSHFTHYERMCLTKTAEEVWGLYPKLSLPEIREDIKRMKAQDTEWERARFLRFLKSVKHLIYKFKND